MRAARVCQLDISRPLRVADALACTSWNRCEIHDKVPEREQISRAHLRLAVLVASSQAEHHRHSEATARLTAIQSWCDGRKIDQISSRYPPDAVASPLPHVSRTSTASSEWRSRAALSRNGPGSWSPGQR